MAVVHGLTIERKIRQICSIENRNETHPDNNMSYLLLYCCLTLNRVDEIVVIEAGGYNYDREDNAYQVKDPQRHRREEIQLLFVHVYVWSREAF